MTVDEAIALLKNRHDWPQDTLVIINVQDAESIVQLLEHLKEMPQIIATAHAAGRGNNTV